MIKVGNVFNKDKYKMGILLMVINLIIIIICNLNNNSNSIKIGIQQINNYNSQIKTPNQLLIIIIKQINYNFNQIIVNNIDFIKHIINLFIYFIYSILYK